jgi:hypothetical protein
MCSTWVAASHASDERPVFDPEAIAALTGCVSGPTSATRRPLRPARPAESILAASPPGQLILVGHHSQRRRALNRLDHATRACSEHSAKASEFQRRAELRSRKAHAGFIYVTCNIYNPERGVLRAVRLPKVGWAGLPADVLRGLEIKGDRVSVIEQHPREDGKLASLLRAIRESRAVRGGGLASVALVPTGLVQKLSVEAVLGGVAWIVFAGAIGQLGRWLVHRRLYRFTDPNECSRCRQLTFWVEVEGALTGLWLGLAIAMLLGLAPITAGILSALLCLAVLCVSVNIMHLARVLGLRTGTEGILYWHWVRTLRRKLRATPLAFLDWLFGGGKRGRVSRFVVWITAALVLAAGPAIGAVIQPSAWPKAGPAVSATNQAECVAP